MAKQCQKCQSERIMRVSAKCSDLCWVSEVNKHRNADGYVPGGIGIDDGTGDYVSFDYCLQCGQIQGEFPIRARAVNKIFRD